MNGAPSQIDLWDYKPKLGRALRHRPAGLDPQRPAADDDDLGPEAVSHRAHHLQVRPARPVRHDGQRVAAAHGAGRGRTRGHPDRLHRSHQPRPGLDLHPDRQPGARQAEHRRLALLRPGQRGRKPAGVRGHDAALVGQARCPGALPAALGRRLPALAAPGRGVALGTATRCCT